MEAFSGWFFSTFDIILVVFEFPYYLEWKDIPGLSCAFFAPDLESAISPQEPDFFFLIEEYFKTTIPLCPKAPPILEVLGGDYWKNTAKLGEPYQVTVQRGGATFPGARGEPEVRANHNFRNLNCALEASNSLSSLVKLNT